ncbi:hypothetical protein Plec18167_009094 [Paecilomyces lecythidis]|uniref:Alpha/beta hydrolase fold-3 domain-containing protein n=1 Tax=Paecilomyces lecythidis TaxID=3004212 RepID=A0ABR3WRU4_9EURO
MNLCSSLLQASPSLEVAVLNVNYRHTPEFKFPSQQCDAWAAFSSFASGGSLSSTYKIDPKRILMGGTSAGAALSIATAIKDMRRQQQAVAQKDIQQISRLQGLILSSSPTVHPDLFPFVSLRAKEVSSYEQFQNSGVLPTPRARYFYNMYIAEDDEDTSKRSELVSPLLIPNESWEPSFWPRTSIHVAGADAFRDEGILFAEKLQGLGIETKLRIHRGYPHAFERFPSLVESEKWRAQIVDDIKWLLG